MPLAGFEPTIPVYKRSKTFHALDHAATVTGKEYAYSTYNTGALNYFLFVVQLDLQLQSNLKSLIKTWEALRSQCSSSRLGATAACTRDIIHSS
jgi:hypothetical protein